MQIPRAALEVSTNTTFHFTPEGMRNCILLQIPLLAPVLALEVLLRMLTHLTDPSLLQYNLRHHAGLLLDPEVFRLGLECSGRGGILPPVE